MSPRNMIIDDKQEEISVLVGNDRSSSINRGNSNESNYQKINDEADYNIKYGDKKDFKS